MRVDSLAIAVVLASATVACQRGPATLEDCLLQKIKTDMSKDAVGLVTQACVMKFQKSDSRSTPLTPSQLAALDGRAGLDFSSRYSGTLYNANDDITVTEVDLDVTTTIGGTEVTKTYRTTLSISPRSTGTFGFDVIRGDDGAKYSWTISAAKGYKASR